MSNSATKKKNIPHPAKPKNNIESLNRFSKFENIITNIICLLVFIAFGYIAVVGFFQTSVIDPANYGSEVILYQADNVALNIFFTAIFGVFVFAMKKKYDFFAKVNMKITEVLMVAFVLICGFIWIFSVTSVPAADSYNIFESATQAAHGNYSSFTNGSTFYNSDYYNGYSYFNFYPFQLGFVFICEIIYRIFGTSTAMPVQVINVLCVAAAYLAVAKITKLVFKRRAIEFIAILLLAGCFQPIFFCTFSYGNIIGMCCALWATYFLIRYFQSEKYLLLIPCALLLILSTLAKYNNLIYLVAFVIVLIVHTVKRKKWQSIAFALALCIAVIGSSNLVILSYEKRAGVDYPNGISQIMYLEMGLNESYMASGWYNGIALENYKNNNLDNSLANEQASRGVSERLSYMASNPEYGADFFNKKLLSQWNEPTFESIWVSEVKSHYYDLNGIGNSMYNGSLGQFFELYFGFYMQILYILFAVGMFCLITKRKVNIQTAILPLVLLGGLGYHLLFEGKSQYILTYIILMIPTAAYAMNYLFEADFTELKNFINKLKTIPVKNKE